MPPQVDLAITALNLLAGAGLLVMLCVLTWVSWAVVRSRASTQHRVLRTTRERLVPVLWVALFAFVATGLYGEAHGASMGLPNFWEAAAAGDNRGYALLTLGGYLFAVQVVVGLTALTKDPQGGWSTRRAQPPRHGGSDLGAALIATMSLAASFFAVLAMATVGYLQVLAHTAI
jgi:hypothetical protein